MVSIFIRLSVWDATYNRWIVQHTESEEWEDKGLGAIYARACDGRLLSDQQRGPPYFYGEKWVKSSLNIAGHPAEAQWELVQQESNWCGGPHSCFGGC